MQTDVSPEKKPIVLTEFGMLMDSSTEDFNAYLNSKEVGHVLSLKNLIASTYEEMKLIKEGIVQLLNNPYHTDEKREEISTSLSAFYVKMLSTEEKFLLCQENLKERSSIL